MKSVKSTIIKVGPIEWNPLNPVKLKDESLFVALSWWGDDDEPPTKLPLSNSRQSTTYFKVTRSMKTLQCYLTDMGALTLTLCDKNDTVIGMVILVSRIWRSKKDGTYWYLDQTVC